MKKQTQSLFPDLLYKRCITRRKKITFLSNIMSLRLVMKLLIPKFNFQFTLNTDMWRFILRSDV